MKKKTISLILISIFFVFPFMNFGVKTDTLHTNTLHTSNGDYFIIYTPVANDTLHTGIHLISWGSASPDCNWVNIFLYLNSLHVENISFFESNDGLVLWDIEEDDFVTGTNYQIKIVNSYNATEYTFSDNFTINCHIEREIIFFSPTNKTVFSNGDNLIMWFSTKTIKTIGIDLYYNGTFLESLDSYGDNKNNYSWTIKSTDSYINGSLYQIKIYDKFSDYFVFSGNFTIEIYPECLCNDEEPFPTVEIIILILASMFLMISAILLLRHYLLRRQFKEDEELNLGPPPL